MPLRCPGPCRSRGKAGRSRSARATPLLVPASPATAARFILTLTLLMAEFSPADGGVQHRRQSSGGTIVTAYTGQLVSTGCAATAATGSLSYAANSTATALDTSSSCSGADLNFSLLETVAAAPTGSPTGSPAPYVRYTLDPASSLKVVAALSGALQGCVTPQGPVNATVTGVVLGPAAEPYPNLAMADTLYVDELELQLACSGGDAANDGGGDPASAFVVAIVMAVGFVLITAGLIVRRTLRRRRGGGPSKPPRRDSGPGPLPQQRQRRSMFEREFHELLETGLIRVDSTLKDELMASPAAEKAVEIDRRLLVCGDLVGQGHFGNIYMGTYVRSQNDVLTVAIKMLKEGHTDEDRNDMTRECAVTSLFDHDNVVRMIGVVTIGEPMMLCLEYYQQGSLLAVLRASKPGGSIMLAQQLVYCKGVAKGMEYLHSLNYVHRDLACRNVLVAADDSPKIADFGLSKALDDGEYYRSSNTDTPLPIRWMPKEAFMGQKFSEASDVWSFGITCCEIFTGGDNPWGTVPNFTVMELIKAGVRHDQPDLCPNMLYDQVLLGCFHPRPAERHTFAKVNELLEAGFDDLQTRLDSRRVSIDSEHSIDAAFGYTTLCSESGQLAHLLQPDRKSTESALHESIQRLAASWSSPENTNGYVGAGILNSSIFSGKGISRATSAPALRLELQSPGLMLRPQFRRSSARTPPKLLAKSTSKSRITLLPATPSHSRSRLTPMGRFASDDVSSRYGTPRARMDILLDDTPHGPTIIHEERSVGTHPDAATTGTPPKFVLVEEDEDEEDGGAGVAQSTPTLLGASPGVQIHAAGNSAVALQFSPMSPQAETIV